VDIRIEKPPVGGEVKAIASKPQAHRLLICAALADKNTRINCAERSDDIDATVSCLVSLGARIAYDGAGFKVQPSGIPVPTGPIIQVCGQSGATLRFMLPVCCALGVPAEFLMLGQLRKRPSSPLLEQLAANGCDIAKHDGGLRCSGKLSSGEYFLKGNVSSQFMSGLLLALPLLEGYSVISVEGVVESMPFVTMTLDILRAFGVRIHLRGLRGGRGSVYLVEGPQNFRTPGTLVVEGDWSCAAPWLSAGAIRGSGVTCTGLNLGSNQGDMAITRLLERFGAKVAYEGDKVTVYPAELRGIEIDASDTPDLVPFLAVVAAAAKGETVINNAGRLRHGGNDRLRAVAETLRALGADITERQDGLVVRGVKALAGGSVPSRSDHRIVMMAAIASAACDGPVTITGAGAVSKSYPEFFVDFAKLGGKTAKA